jgi:hypothetical protein
VVNGEEPDFRRIVTSRAPDTYERIDLQLPQLEEEGYLEGL